MISRNFINDKWMKKRPCFEIMSYSIWTPQLGVVIKVSFYFGYKYKIGISIDNGLKFGLSKQYNPKNDLMIKSIEIKTK